MGEKGSAGSSRDLGRCLVDLGLERCVQSPVCIGAMNPLEDKGVFLQLCCLGCGMGFN